MARLVLLQQPDASALPWHQMISLEGTEICVIPGLSEDAFDDHVVSDRRTHLSGRRSAIQQRVQRRRQRIVENRPMRRRDRVVVTKE